MNDTTKTHNTAMATQYWGANLPMDCVKWLRGRAKATADTQTEIVKRLIRDAMHAEEEARRQANS